MLKGQLNCLISAKAMFCSKSYVWELESTASAACLVCLILRMGAEPYHFRPWGPHMPTQRLMSNDYRPGTALCSGKFKRQAPTLEDSNLTEESNKHSVGAHHMLGLWHILFHSILIRL